MNPLTRKWRPKPELLSRWDRTSEWFRLADAVYVHEVESFRDECEGFLPSVCAALLRERMRDHAAQVTHFDGVEEADEERRRAA